MHGLFGGKEKKCLFMGIWAVVFFLLYNFLFFFAPHVWNSPDETANAVFIKEFARTGSLAFPHPVDYGPLAEFVHPRSTYVRASTIIPVGFWGLVVGYGVIATWVGLNGVLLVTSSLIILSAFAYYALMRHIFSERIAWWSFLLFLAHPAIWYYTNRPLLPNISFLSFLLFGAYFFVIQPLSTHVRTRYKELCDDIFGSLCMGVVFFIRPNESVWILLGACIVLLLYRRDIRWFRFVTWGGIAALFAGAFVWTNSQVYGSAVGTYIASQSLSIQHWYSYFFPFGIDVIQLLRSGYVFLVRMFWWYVGISAIGIGLALLSWFRDRLPRERRAYLVVYGSISLYLLLYYGSFRDQLFSLHTIGVAYVRYWLPVFVGMLPFIPYAIEEILIRFKKPQWFGIIMSIFFVCILGFNARLVFGGADGLIALRRALFHIQEVRLGIVDIVEPHAILLTESEDKFFWPKYQVMVKPFHPDILSATKEFLQQGQPVYYFGPVVSPDRFKEITSAFQQLEIGSKEIYRNEPHILYRLFLK